MEKTLTSTGDHPPIHLELAYWRLGLLRGPEIVWLATRLLVEGIDSASIRMLAGESDIGSEDAAKQLDRALEEARVSPPSEAAALAAVAENYLRYGSTAKGCPHGDERLPFSDVRRTEIIDEAGSRQACYIFVRTGKWVKPVKLTLSYDDRVLDGEGWDCFTALVAVRRQLDSQELILHCYGASREVHGSSREYPDRLCCGDEIDPLATGPDVDPVSVEDQRYYRKALNVRSRDSSASWKFFENMIFPELENWPVLLPGHAVAAFARGRWLRWRWLWTRERKHLALMWCTDMSPFSSSRYVILRSDRGRYIPVPIRHRWDAYVVKVILRVLGVPIKSAFDVRQRFGRPRPR